MERGSRMLSNAHAELDCKWAVSRGGKAVVCASAIMDVRCRPCWRCLVPSSGGAGNDNDVGCCRGKQDRKSRPSQLPQHTQHTIRTLLRPGGVKWQNCPWFCSGRVYAAVHGK